jgi:hypothetical protein
MAARGGARLTVLVARPCLSALAETVHQGVDVGVDVGLAGGADLALALWLASGWRPRAAVASTLLLVLGYTLVFGALVPALWLDPLGGLAKNLVLLPALAVLWVLSDRR